LRKRRLGEKEKRRLGEEEKRRLGDWEIGRIEVEFFFKKALINRQFE
jgi:hypothetical protein